MPAENDDAADWLSEFVESPSIIALNQAFDDVLSADSGSYLEIAECSVAVLAAAVVAELFGRTGTEPILDEDDLALVRSLSKKLAPGARISLVKAALESTQLVMLETERSELFQAMGEDADMGRRWSQHMCRLIQDLREVRQRLTGSGRT